MRRLDHTDIVGTIADCKEQGLVVLLDEFDDQSLLQGRDTT